MQLQFRPFPFARLVTLLRVAVARMTLTRVTMTPVAMTPVAVADAILTRGTLALLSFAVLLGCSSQLPEEEDKTADCAGNQESCGGVCTDTLLDNLNCGDCGAACVPGAGCAVGGCACANPAYTACEIACLDTSADPLNCGSCGAACALTERCETGACTCRTGTELCGESCVQTISDPLNCGLCNNVCSAELVCSLGACSDSCAPGLTRCGQSCVDATTDFQNCGGCGAACGAGQDCVEGACSCPEGQELCDGACVDVGLSNLHCGSCGNTCAPGASCSEGACSCGSGQTDCSGTCINTQSNALNCGGCGEVCGSGLTCQAGQCVAGTAACADGLTDCDGTCVDLQASKTDCGVCGTDCGALSCVDGACVAAKICANKATIQAPSIASFETYDGTLPVTDWGFAFNAPAGSPAAVYSGLYTFSDGIGSHALTMAAGNASAYAPRIHNPAPGGAGAWGGAVGLWMGCVDASDYTGLSLFVKGPVPTGTVSLSLSMEQTTPPDANNPDAGGTCLSDCSDATIEIEVTDSWSQVILPWSAFTPGTANASTVPVTGDNLSGLSFNVNLAYVEDSANPGEYIPGPAPYDFSFDDLTFITGAGTCPSGQTLCGTSCVNTASNPAHCGACDDPCADGLACSGGACECPGTQTLCDEVCVNTATDVDHCGDCDQRCLGTCSGGTCNTSSCGAVDRTPFGCDFAWGAAENTGNRSSYLDVITTWVGYEHTQGRAADCDGCGLVTDLADTNAMAGYYAYFIGSALPDCNVEPDSPDNLCHAGAQYIRDNRDEIIDLYAAYAQKTYQASPNKPVFWLLEGDFVQYTYAEQSNPLTVAELGTLASDIVCAIKAAAPNALVAINHSPWISNDLANQFWNAMPLASTDFVWTTGTGTNNGYINSGANSGSYNATTATYAWLHQKTGMGIFVDTSFGPSQQADSWSSASVSNLNARIAEGVFAANVTEAPTDYQTRVSTLSPQLSSTCP